MLNKIEKYKPQVVLILCGLVASFLWWSRVHFFSLFFGDTAVRYFDTDDYMIIVRLRDFFQNFDLSNSIISRANFPYGGDMHWTRIYDFFLIIPSYFFNFFLHDINKSTEYIGFLISPIIKCMMLVILYDCYQKIASSKTAAFITTLLIAIHPALNYTNMFARPDHHAFIFLMMSLYLLYITEICESDFKNYRPIIKAGIIAALNIWTSPETLIFLLLSDGVIFLYIQNNAAKMRAMGIKSTSTAATIFLLLFFPPEFFIEYDKISIVHFMLYVFATGFFIIYPKMNKVWEKCALMIGLGLAFLWLYPQFFLGMEAGLSAKLREVWFDTNVDEMKSPFALGQNSSTFFALYMLIATLAAYDMIQNLINKNKNFSDLIWWIIIASCLCYEAFSCIADRMRATFAFFSIPLILEFGLNSTITKNFHKYIKITIGCVLAIGLDVTQKYTPILSLYINHGPSQFKEFCELRRNAYFQEDRFFKFLDSISATPVTILTYLGKAAPTLYYTKHNVVAAPYHRQEQGIIAFYEVMESPYNENKIKEIFQKTKTDYVFISKGMCYSNPQKTANSFAGMLVQGRCPLWADIVPIPIEFEDVILVKINREKF